MRIPHKQSLNKMKCLLNKYYCSHAYRALQITVLYRTSDVLSSMSGSCYTQTVPMKICCNILIIDTVIVIAQLFMGHVEIIFTAKPIWIIAVQYLYIKSTKIQVALLSAQQCRSVSNQKAYFYVHRIKNYPCFSG